MRKQLNKVREKVIRDMTQIHESQDPSDLRKKKREEQSFI